MIKDVIEDAASLERTGSNTDHFLDGYRFLEKQTGGVMIEQEDKLQKDELTAAYLLGCHDTRKAYESRIKRYNHAVRREPYPMSRMYETAEGKYVQFEDYEALQQRLAEAEELKADFKKAMATYELTGFDDSLWELLDAITKGE